MQIYFKRIAIVVAAGAAVMGSLNLPGLVFATVPGNNQRVNMTSSGGQPNDGSSNGLVSADGRFVVFNSVARNILPTGGGGTFLRNLSSGSISRVNVSTSGAIDDSGGNNTIPHKISATGRYVLFTSYATNLIDNTVISASVPQLYLRDTSASTTSLISQSLNGAVSNGSLLTPLGVSSDGRFIAFSSNASNLHTESTDGKTHLYMLDRLDNSLTILDRKTDGTLVSQNFGSSGSMSCDGSMITFEYGANLIAGDIDSGHVDVYLLDRRGSADKLTNLTKFANAAARGPSISCNGDYIGFSSRSNNIDTSRTIAAGYIRPYVFDRVNGTYMLASVTASNTVTNTAICGTIDGPVQCIGLSDTGLGVFSMTDTSLTGATGTQVYLRDLYAGTTELVSRSSTGIAGNDKSQQPTITASGKSVVYTSGATNLVSNDTNGWYDVFMSSTGN